MFSSKMFEKFQEQLDIVNNLEDATNTLVYDPNSVDTYKVSENQKNLDKKLEELSNIANELQKTKRKINSDIQITSDSIEKYRKTLHNNQNLFNSYSEEIQKNMGLIATRDRMLQLSQERNAYKKKVIYVLFSIIIALLISVISTYTFFGKMVKK